MGLSNGGSSNGFDVETLNSVPTLRETHIVIQQTGFGIAIYFDGVFQNTNLASTGTIGCMD